MPSTPDAPAPPILDVRELSVAFEAAPVLDQITFSLPAGASLAVIGPNGAGKTVLFRALLGAVPHTGTVHWAPGVRIGYVPQKLDIERDIPITGRDFLTARLAVERDATERPDIAAVLRLVGLSGIRAASPSGRSPVVSSNASSSPSPCSATRRCCSSTSRPPASINPARNG
jgi:zinc transport system ATP-binding protein